MALVQRREVATTAVANVGVLLLLKILEFWNGACSAGHVDERTFDIYWMAFRIVSMIDDHSWSSLCLLELVLYWSG